MVTGFPQNPGFGVPYPDPYTAILAGANPAAQFDPFAAIARRRLDMRDSLGAWARYIDELGGAAPPSVAAAQRALSSPTSRTATGTATSDGVSNRYMSDGNGNTTTTINIDKSGGTAISDQSGGNGNRGRGAGNGGSAGGRPATGAPPIMPGAGFVPTLPNIGRGVPRPERTGGRPDTGGRGPGRMDARQIVQKWQNRFRTNQRGGMGGPGGTMVPWPPSQGTPVPGMQQPYTGGMGLPGRGPNNDRGPAPAPPRPQPPLPQPPLPPQTIYQYVNPFGQTSDAAAQQYARWLGLDPSAYGGTSMADYLDLQLAATSAGQGTIGADGSISYGNNGTGVYYPGMIEAPRPIMPPQPVPPPGRPLPPIQPPRPPDPVMPGVPGAPGWSAGDSTNKWVQKAQAQGIDTSGWANNGQNAKKDYQQAMRTYSPQTQTPGQQAAYSPGMDPQQGAPAGSYRAAAPTGIRTSAVNLPRTGAVNRYRQTRGF